MTALNESAEDIMSRTVESSFERETDPAEEAEQLRKYQQMQQSKSRSTPVKRGGTGYVPTIRETKLTGRTAAPVEEKENVQRNTRSSLGGSAKKAPAVTRSPAQGLVAAASAGAARAEPRQRAGTGRAITSRTVEFVKRVKEPEPEPEPELEPVKVEVLPNRGRRTGLRIKQEIAKDEFGLEDLSEFWDAEEPAEPSVNSDRRVSFKSRKSSLAAGVSPVSHRSSFSTTTGLDIDESSDMEVDGVSPIDSGRRSSLRSASSSKGSSQLDSSLLSPDAGTIKQLSFEEGSTSKSRSSLSSNEDADEDEREEDDERDQSMEDDVPSFDAPEDDDQMDGVDESRRASDVFDEADRAGEAEEKLKRKREAGDKKRELEALNRAGRASYVATDSYAPKAGRLSMFAPRPEVDEDEDNCRRSKRRKMRPLEYWRGERVLYGRVNKSPKTPRTAAAQGLRAGKASPKAAVPEIVDVQIRSPAQTPWRRKPAKGKAEPEPTSSVESKSATVKKAARTKKKAENKAEKKKEAAVKKEKKVRKAVVSSDDEEDTVDAKIVESKKQAAAAAAVQDSFASDKSGASPKQARKTAFFLFCKEKRPDVRRSHPNASIPEQAMVLSEMWRAMADTNKEKYRSMAVAV